MNSDTCETVEQLAKESGAIIPCPICGSDLYAEDGEADEATCARATVAWKARGRGMPRMEMIHLVRSVLEDAPTTCSCP